MQTILLHYFKYWEEKTSGYAGYGNICWLPDVSKYDTSVSMEMMTVSETLARGRNLAPNLELRHPGFAGGSV